MWMYLLVSVVLFSDGPVNSVVNGIRCFNAFFPKFYDFCHKEEDQLDNERLSTIWSR